MNTLNLPNLSIISDKDIFNDEHLLVLGGRAPNLNWLKETAKNRKLWAVDRGINSIIKANLFPDFLIGDNDSANDSLWDEAVKKGIAYEKYPPEKDYTDFELALGKLKKDAFAVVTGAFGGRFDHAFSNVFSVSHANNRAFLADEKEILLFLKNGDNFKLVFKKNPKAISVIPITEKCSGITFKGVHWELENETICQNNPNTISNVLENENECKISLNKGILGVYIVFEESNL